MKYVRKYLKKAAELKIRASETDDPLLKISYLDRANSYKALAEDRRQRILGQSDENEAA
jgi:hypothetical protein